MTEPGTNPSVLWHEMIREATVFLDNQMTHVLDWFAINPAYGAPAKLGDHLMVHVPCLEVDSAPYTVLFTPQRPYALKHQAARVESRVCSFELAVVFVDHL